MRSLTWFIGGFIASIFAIVSVVSWIVTGAKVDLNDPKSVKVFKSGFERDCIQYVSGEMKQKGEAPDYQQEALLKQVCACDANAMLKLLQRQKTVKLADTVGAKKALRDGTPEMKAAFQSCAQAYGLQ